MRSRIIFSTARQFFRSGFSFQMRLSMKPTESLSSSSRSSFASLSGFRSFSLKLPSIIAAASSRRRLNATMSKKSWS